MSKPFTGQCLCGSVKFEVVGEPTSAHTCSCRQCQRHSGAMIQFWLEFRSEQVRWLNKKPATWRSSDYSSRSFCPKCGSTLGAIDDEPVIALTLGSFDSPSRKALKPKSHSYISRRPKWLKLHVED